GLPHEPSITTDEFLEATLDVWRIPPESARRVGHPAPFPVLLPPRLIEPYTFRDDPVLDPFLGSGSTPAAAARTRRRYARHDTHAGYVTIARQRVADELRLQAAAPSQAAENGKAAGATAVDLLTGAGFTMRQRNRTVPGLGVAVSMVADDAAGQPWYFD